MWSCLIWEISRQEKPQPSVYHLSKVLQRAWGYWTRVASAPSFWGTSQRVGVVFAVGVFSGAVDEPEMPPEESNWDGNWKLGQMRSSWRNRLCWPGEDKLGLGEQEEGWQEAAFKYLKCCQVEERLELCCVVPVGTHRASECRLQGQSVSWKEGSIL